VAARHPTPTPPRLRGGEDKKPDEFLCKESRAVSEMALLIYDNR
jgi:hypothetical protein